MKEKFISNVLFVVIAIGIYGLSYLCDKYISNPKVIVFTFVIVAFIYVTSKWYQYFIRCNIMILKKINIKRIIFTLFIVSFCFLNPSENDPEILWLTLTKQQWIGIGFMILGTIWMFQFISFTKYGIYRPNSFVKDYYSELTSFELTDNTITYTTHNNNDRYYARIRKINSKTRTSLLRTIDQYAKIKFTEL